MPERVKSSFVIFDIRALWRSQDSCTHMATVGVKGLIDYRLHGEVSIVQKLTTTVLGIVMVRMGMC